MKLIRRNVFWVALWAVLLGSFGVGLAQTVKAPLPQPGANGAGAGDIMTAPQEIPTPNKKPEALPQAMTPKGDTIKPPTIQLEIQLDYAIAQADLAQSQASVIQAKTRADQLEQRMNKTCAPWVPAWKPDRDPQTGEQTRRYFCVEAPKQPEAPPTKK